MALKEFCPAWRGGPFLYLFPAQAEVDPASTSLSILSQLQTNNKWDMEQMEKLEAAAVPQSHTVSGREARTCPQPSPHDIHCSFCSAEKHLWIGDNSPALHRKCTSLKSAKHSPEWSPLHVSREPRHSLAKPWLQSLPALCRSCLRLPTGRNDVRRALDTSAHGEVLQNEVWKRLEG